ncbi:MAG: GAF domain-containing protein [Planctomycetia bacterium]|nr:GAF domain-containing protein [Planctomycetia bacterium]
MNDNTENNKSMEEKSAGTNVDLFIVEDANNGRFLKSDLGPGTMSRHFFDQISTGVVVVNINHQVVDYNQSFEDCVRDKEEATYRPNYYGQDFYALFNGQCEIEGPDFCPFATVKTTLRPTETTLRIGDRTIDMKVKGLTCPETREITSFLVELTNSTKYTVLQQKIGLLQEIGRKLTDLTAKEILEMSDGERKELIKCNIMEGIKQLFPYVVFEIRLLVKETHVLEPFIAEGMTEEAKNRVLHAEATGNGTTGNVALFNKPYYCEDIQDDTFYLTGAENTRSTYTLPITYHNEVVGTFHLESSYPSDFSLGQQKLLKYFSDDIAEAIHILTLLSAENRKAAWEKVTKILEVVAIPFDQLIRDISSASEVVCVYQKDLNFLLNAAKNQLETKDFLGMREAIGNMYAQIGEDLEQFVRKFGESIVSIRDQCRTVKDVISHEKDKLEGDDTQDPKMIALLRNRRILVIDKDDTILLKAHRILEKMGCIVETASDALTALQMAQGSKYDAIITERTPLGGMDAEQFMIRLENIYTVDGESKVPLVILRENGIYDTGHIIANCRLRGGSHVGIICRDPLIETQIFLAVFTAIKTCCEKDENGDPILLTEPSGSSRSGDGVHLSPLGSTSFSTSGIRGFHLQAKAKRFDQWAEQIRILELDDDGYEDHDDDEENPPMNVNALDAT